MRPPPLWLLWLLLCGLGATAPPLDSFSQLAAPQHLNLRLYNDEQILSWAPSAPTNDTRPVVYQVEYKFISGSWRKVKDVNCTDITETKCDFTGGGGLKSFTGLRRVQLRVRAKQGSLTSEWVTLSPFEHYCNVTVGPPKNISVTPGKGSLIIHFSPPFDVTEATFDYCVHYWEQTGTQQVRGPFKKNSIVLNDLKPFRVYCLQIETQLFVRDGNTCQPRFSFSNVSCHETTGNAYTRLQVILIPLGIFLSLLVLTGACFFLFLKYQSRVKYWFQAPPNIPEQIKEYLKDPDQPILEVLDKDSSPKDDAWDSVSIISSLEKEPYRVLRTL